MSTSPILGFICPKCHHGMRPVCDACEEREQIRAGEQASAEQSAEQQAHHARLAEWRTIPGYQALEDDLETYLYHLATVLVEADADEDGPTGVFTATLSGMPGLPADSGRGHTPEAAIQMLRREITKALRAAADGLDGRQTASLDDGDRAVLFDALEGHADRLAVAGQIERSQAVHGLLVRLGKGAD